MRPPTRSRRVAPVAVLLLVPVSWLVAACGAPAPAASEPAASQPPATTSVASRAPGTPSTLPVDPTPVTGEPEADVVVVASNLAFEPAAITVAAGAPFGLGLDNRDAGIPHNLQVTGPDGSVIATTAIVVGPSQVGLTVPALGAGTYAFSCSVHPNMTGTLTAE